MSHSPDLATSAPLPLSSQPGWSPAHAARLHAASSTPSSHHASVSPIAGPPSAPRDPNEVLLHSPYTTHRDSQHDITQARPSTGSSTGRGYAGQSQTSLYDSPTQRNYPNPFPDVPSQGPASHMLASPGTQTRGSWSQPGTSGVQAGQGSVGQAQRTTPGTWDSFYGIPRQAQSAFAGTSSQQGSASSYQGTLPSSSHRLTQSTHEGAYQNPLRVPHGVASPQSGYPSSSWNYSGQSGSDVPAAYPYGSSAQMPPNVTTAGPPYGHSAYHTGEGSRHPGEYRPYPSGSSLGKRKPSPERESRSSKRARLSSVSQATTSHSFSISPRIDFLSPVVPTLSSSPNTEVSIPNPSVAQTTGFFPQYTATYPLIPIDAVAGPNRPESDSLSPKTGVLLSSKDHSDSPDGKGLPEKENP